MPIIKSTKTANGSSVEYHKLVRLDANMAEGTATISVQSYTDEAAANAKLPVAWNWVIPIDPNKLVGSDIVSAAEGLLTASGATFDGGTITTDLTASLEVVKARKAVQITADRLAADADHFSYQGKDIRTADKDMCDLLVADARISKGTEMPANWPGGWKAVDNTFLLISTVDEWNAFFIAMYDAGISNFTHSQTLKTALEAATTVDEVDAIKW